MQLMILEVLVKSLPFSTENRYLQTFFFFLAAILNAVMVVSQIEVK